MSRLRLPARARWTALALALLAATVYANAVPNGFALDDGFIIENNDRVHGIDRLPDAVSNPYWPGSPGRLGLYRPVTAATYAIEWDLWGGRPEPFHATNIALHAAVTALLFLLLIPLVGRIGAAAGSALFAVHPVHVEAVANLVGRAELLATAGVLTAALLYLRMEPDASWRRRWGGAAGIGLVYFLALGAKEIAVTLPGLLVVLEAGREGRSGVREIASRVVARWPVYLLLGVALAAYLLLRASVLGTPVGADEAGFLQPLTAWERVLTAVAVWPEYLRLMLFPLHLVADYSPGVLMPVTGFGPRVWAGLLTGGLVVLVAGYAWSRERSVALGVAWFVVAVFPVSNLVIPVGILLAERTLYLPSVGLALAVGGAVHWLRAKRPGWARPAAAVLLVAVALAGARTWLRTPTWRTTGTVLATLAEDHPESFRVQWLEADRLRSAGRFEESLARYRTAVSLVPGHYQLRMQYGRALLQAGRLDAAIQELRAARDLVPELAEAHAFLMAALLRARQPADAVDAGRAALRWHPDHRGIQHQLAIALTRTGGYEAALEARLASIRLGGDRAAWQQFVHAAELHLRLGQDDAAAAALTEAARRAPEDAPVPSLAALRSAVETADTAGLPYR